MSRSSTCFRATSNQRLGLGRLFVVMVLVALLVIGAAIYLISVQQSGTSLSSFGIERLLISNANSNSSISGFVYVAETETQQVQGFQGSTGFGDCNGYASNSSKCIGMTFVFTSEQMVCLWMHNTVIPLQQVWISGNGTATAVFQAQPMSDFTVCHSATYALETSPDLPIYVGSMVRQSSA